MFKKLIHQLQLFVIFIYDLVFRSEKYIKFLLTGKHEFERICEIPCDIYEKTMQIDRWLIRSKCRRIRQFFDENLNHKLIPSDGITGITLKKILSNYSKSGDERLTDIAKDNTRLHANCRDLSPVNLEDGDVVLINLLNELTDQLIRVILRVKKVKLNSDKKDILRDIIYRILSFNLSLTIALKIATTRYDSSIPSHKNKLISLWNNLVEADEQKAAKDKDSRAFPTEPLNSVIKGDESIVSSRWSLIGFQGEDPGTDFRGMGLLGLEQLEYLSRKSKYVARDLLKRSLNADYEYPFAITGINITYNLVNLYKDGSMKHLYYDYGDSLFRNKRRNLNLIRTLNDLYVELYLRFDCFWRESKPENILVFNELMENFVNIIRMDLGTRNFSMKFIY